LFYNNNSLLQTRGPYRRDHRHKSTKMVSHTVAVSVLHMSNMERSKTLYQHHNCIVINKSTKWLVITEPHCRIDVWTCPTLRGAKTLQHFLLFVRLVCTHCPHVFYYTKAILVRRENRNNSPTTTAFGIHHTGLHHFACVQKLSATTIILSW